jgi:hypothetical protein|tara:strand:+ start:903 stop:1109 length:207 start_codon:yes stop_codon:yes gene_type:complete
MKNHFEHKLVLKIEKDSSACNLSVKTSEDKVEVYKLDKRDIAYLVSQYLEYDPNMKEARETFIIKTVK